MYYDSCVVHQYWRHICTIDDHNCCQLRLEITDWSLAQSIQFEITTLAFRIIVLGTFFYQLPPKLFLNSENKI